MKKKRNILKLVDALAAEERAVLSREFMSPAVPGVPVQVRIAGVRCGLKVTPASFRGWGVFRPTSASAAELVRSATLTERARYLEMFPALSLVLAGKDGDIWMAIAAGRDDRFALDGPVEVQLVQEADLFDIVRTRFDGRWFWFDSVDRSADPRAAAALRHALVDMTEPANLAIRGATEPQRELHARLHAARKAAAELDERSRTERLLANALRHGGATLRDYAERGDSYTVTFTVDGRRHTSVVRKGDLTVQTAGICLSGEDESFDLQSLVGVLREGNRRGELRWMRH